MPRSVLIDDKGHRGEATPRPRATQRVAPTIEIIDWGFLPYRDAHARMLQAVADRIAGRMGDTIFLVEHPHVYTCGRGASFGEQQSIVPFPRADPVEVVAVERGGEVTYHGPGQLVAYPIVDVRRKTGDLHQFLRWLEDIIIRTIAHWGIHGERHPSHTGVWIEGRKIASIGIAVRGWVSYHGLALNVSTDLRYFGGINPCGLPPEVMTSMATVTGHAIALADVREVSVAALTTSGRRVQLTKARLLRRLRIR